MKGFSAMALQYKINVLEALKEKGYTTYALRKEKLLSESTIQKLRVGEGVAWDNLETLCKLLDCDISDLLEYIKEDN
jgi:putative transcriptional regulator